MSDAISGRGPSPDETLVEQMDRLHPERMAQARAELGPPPATRRRGPRQSGRTLPSDCCWHCTVEPGDECPDAHSRPCRRCTEAGRTPSPTQQAIERELAFYREWAGAPREPLLGCSVISHDRLGYCLTCTSVNGANLEIQGWRLLALREEADREEARRG